MSRHYILQRTFNPAKSNFVALLAIAVLLISQLVIAAHDHADDSIDRGQCELCVKIQSEPEAAMPGGLLFEPESDAKHLFNQKGLPSKRSTLVVRSRAPPLTFPPNALV